MKVAPRMYVRTVSAEEATRLLASGSWVKVVSTDASPRGLARQKKWRAYADRRSKRQGYRVLHAFIPGDVAAALDAVRRPGETHAALIARLVGENGGLVQADLQNGGEGRAHTDTRTDDAEIEDAAP